LPVALPGQILRLIDPLLPLRLSAPLGWTHKPRPWRRGRAGTFPRPPRSQFSCRQECRSCGRAQHCPASS